MRSMILFYQGQQSQEMKSMQIWQVQTLHFHSTNPQICIFFIQHLGKSLY